MLFILFIHVMFNVKSMHLLLMLSTPPTIRVRFKASMGSLRNPHSWMTRPSFEVDLKRIFTFQNYIFIFIINDIYISVIIYFTEPFFLGCRLDNI